MRSHHKIAFATPVFDPAELLTTGFSKRLDPKVTIKLSLNIGLE